MQRALFGAVTMGFEVVEIGPIERKLDIEVPAERVGEEFERIFRSVSTSAKVKGFRPRRIPRPVLERLFGEEVRARVTESLVREAVANALVESALPVVSAPEIDLGAIERGTAFHFSARFEICPEVPEVDIESIIVARPTVTVTDENIDQMLARIRESHAELVAVEDRTEIAPGDFATVALHVSDSGKRVEPYCRESATIEVVGGGLPSEVEERLVQARVGEEFTLEAPAPEGAPPETAGRKLSWTVTVQSLSLKKVPDLDDDFARDHGECETLAALRQQIGSRLAEEENRRADGLVRDAVLDVVLARVPLHLPPSLVRERVDGLLEDFRIQLAMQGMRFTSGPHEDEAREKLKPRAEREVKAGLVLDRIGEQLALKVEDDAVDAEIERLTASAGKRAAEIRTHYREASARSSLRARLLRGRAIEALVARADVTIPVQTVVTAGE